MGHLRIALLVNDTPVQPVIDEFGKYPQIYERWLSESKPEDVAFELTPFDVFDSPEEYPNPTEYDAMILTGSAASAYAPLPWIEQLKEYVARVARDHPRVRLIGICFGHQIIASALGGDCVPNDGIWEIGVTEVDLTPAGRDVFELESVAIQQFHRDHVPSLPSGFILLGSTTTSPIQGMLLPYSPSADGAIPTAQDTHILTVQGHPEFTGPIVEKITGVREQRGILDKARAARARTDAYKPHDGAGAIAKAVWKILLAPSTQQTQQSHLKSGDKVL
ncbi:related to P.aeruginosa anthranilate synthase component II [Serendipita indica DSM 11827]|uniref:Related to P.aeruginosa anthranilate synthase component II n=1 Tax=Serendipita indica (strain DSM 11827) TaxID=1109443 RepID=G4TCZ0_SERID|nr:related to P.aeruginosa anthranilate synthase component II [Serendipita indica DSM 11827]